MMAFLDSQNPVQLLILFFIPPLLILLLSPLRRRRRGNPDNLPLPPRPRPLPIIGNLNLISHLTHRGIASLAEKYGGLFYLSLGPMKFFPVCTPELARHVLLLKDNICANRSTTFTTAYLTYDCSDLAFANYGPYWRQMRKLCVMKLFSRRRAESWASVRDEVVSTVRSIAKSADSSPVKIGDLVFDLTQNITFRAAFGTQPQENQNEFVGILHEFSKLFTEFNIADFLPALKWVDFQGINKRSKDARERLDRFTDKIIDEHKANRKEVDAADADMVDQMLAFVEEGKGLGVGSEGDELKLTSNNIKAIIMDVMFGGIGTIGSVIEWAMAELMRNPEDLERVQQELADVVGLDRMVHESDIDKLPYLKCIIKETLRLHPPLPIAIHVAAEDSEIAGYFIPKDSKLMVNYWAINRDKSSWKDADTFRPSRFAPGSDEANIDFRGNFFELLPFGSGRRSCPGMQLGLYAAEQAVAQLVHCFNWELPDGMKPSELDMNDVFGLTAPRAVRLVAVPTLRLTCQI